GGTCGASDCNAGTGACVYPSGSTSCGSASCSGSTFTPAGTCNGSGSCTAGTAAPCAGNFTCATATACNTTCNVATNAGCDATHYCVGGNSCVLRQANGASCTAAFQCANANCTQGQAGLICASVTCPTACS